MVLLLFYKICKLAWADLFICIREDRVYIEQIRVYQSFADNK